MTASPTVEVIILISSLGVLGFFLFREAFGSNKTNWRWGLADFLARPANEPTTKSIAAIVFGIVLIGFIFFLLGKRIDELWR